MSKELVISAASHERRVAILEEGQLVEIYIEREKEFALVGSIYKGKVTRVLPGMQSAFVDIGLDGDAFLYVSDVFENLEDYDPVHPHEQPQSPAPALPAAIGTPVEVLPGETLAHASRLHDEGLQQPSQGEEDHHVDEGHGSHDEAQAAEGDYLEQHHQDAPPAAQDEVHAEAADERQPDSNASAPQNFAPHYNPTQNYPSRGGNDRPAQNYGRGNDRGGDRGGDRGRGGRWGRRGGGGRHRGGRPQGSPGGGRNLPPSKYASPQGGESRGYDNRGSQPRGYDSRRQDAPRPSSPIAPTDTTEEPILLPGESLAKYRGKPAAAQAPPPVAEHEVHEQQPEVEESSLRGSGSAAPASASGGVPRRFSGGLPRWLLADGGSEAAAADAGELATPMEEASSAESAALESESVRSDVELNEDQVAALASGFVEAKHEETQEEAEADAVVGGAEFEEEDTEEETGEAEAIRAEEDSELSAEETEDVEEQRAVNRAEAEADFAHDSAIHSASFGEHEQTEAEHEQEHDEEHVEEEEISAASGETVVGASVVEEDVILLPGETRAPRIGGSSAPREEFPRSSARIGGNPRSRFQRPFRSGGRDRGRDNRGGRPDSRGGRPDRGGRPGGPRFERRPGGGPRQDRGYQGGRSGPSRRPQLISEMLKAGQDVVIQIAKEPLGKKGARITSHVALPRGSLAIWMTTS